jgi:hypothetical protein
MSLSLDLELALRVSSESESSEFSWFRDPKVRFFLWRRPWFRSFRGLELEFETIAAEVIVIFGFSGIVLIWVSLLIRI